VNSTFTAPVATPFARPVLTAEIEGAAGFWAAVTDVDGASATLLHGAEAFAAVKLQPSEPLRGPAVGVAVTRIWYDVPPVSPLMTRVVVAADNVEYAPDEPAR